MKDRRSSVQRGGRERRRRMRDTCLPALTAKPLHSQSPGSRSAPWVVVSNPRPYAEGVIQVIERCPRLIRSARAVQSIPYVSFVNINAIDLAQTTEFILKCLVFVVFFLIPDIADHIVDFRRTHRKGAISRLPVELAEAGVLLLHPFGRIALDFLQ